MSSSCQCGPHRPHDCSFNAGSIPPPEDEATVAGGRGILDVGAKVGTNCGADLEASMDGSGVHYTRLRQKNAKAAHWAVFAFLDGNGEFDGGI